MLYCGYMRMGRSLISVEIKHTTMAKFKKNDLITDGSTIWRITGVTDTHYIFTEQDQTTISRPIEDIDGRFNLWQSKQVWHKASDEPANGRRIIIVEKLADNSICHDIGYYNKARNIVACELHDVWLEHCQRWAYIEDLVNATLDAF